MKQLRKVFLASLLLVAVSSCTGSSEGSVPSLIAIGWNQNLHFYDAPSFYPGESGPLSELGRWTFATTIQDAIWIRSSDAALSDMVWVLEQDKLSQFSTATLQTTAWPETAPPTAQFEKSFGGNCPTGYLERGNRSVLLLVCPPSGALPLRAWTTNYQSPTELTALDLSGLTDPSLSNPVVRLGVGLRNNQDTLAFATTQYMGFGVTLDDKIVFAELTDTSKIPTSDTPPVDIKLTSTTNGQRLVVSFSNATVDQGGSFGALASWDMVGAPVFLDSRLAGAGFVPSGLARDSTLPPVFIGTGSKGVVAKLQEDGTLEGPPESGSLTANLDSSFILSKGIAGIDRYLYATRLHTAELWVVDLAAKLPSLQENTEYRRIAIPQGTDPGELTTVILIPLVPLE